MIDDLVAQGKKERLYHYRLGLKLECFSAYSDCDGAPCCAQCGWRRLQDLTLDHINNNGKEHREQLVKEGMRYDNTFGEPFYRMLRRKGYPKDLGLQVLCKTCNYGKPKPQSRQVIDLSINIPISFDWENPIPDVCPVSLWNEDEEDSA